MYDLNPLAQTQAQLDANKTNLDAYQAAKTPDTFWGDSLQNIANGMHAVGIATPELGLTEAVGGVSPNQPVTYQTNQGELIVAQPGSSGLNGFTGPDGSTYDGNGNLISSGSGGGGGDTATPLTNTAYNNATYDANGNLISGGSGGGSAPAAPAAPAYSADDLAYIDDQITALTKQKADFVTQKGRLATGLQTGLTGLGDDYNKNLTTQNEKRSRALQDFDIQQGDTMRQKNSAIGKVNTNARILSDSLRRRLGMAGGSDSSAYQITAPGAVARNASTDRTGVVENYGVNFRNLDIGKKRADTDFATLLSNLSDQKRNSERGLRQGILEQENQVNLQENELSTSLANAARQRVGLIGGGYDAAKLASADYETEITNRNTEIANRNTQIDSLFNKYRNPYTVKPVDVKKVNLRDYLVDKQAIQTNQQADTQDPYSPYQPFKQEDDQYQY